MPDPTTFESRLADAFDRYTDAAPRRVDARSLAAELAAGGRGRPLTLPRLAPYLGGLRLAIVLGLLALASVAGLLFAGGFLTPEPAPLGGGGRILAWLPSDGIAHLLGVDGVERGSSGTTPGCPTLLAGADAIAIQRRFPFSTEFVSILDGTLSSLSKNYAGFEMWSPDQSAYAMVDTEKGPASVITFPDGDVAHPTITRYPVFGSVYGAGSFSSDGSRFALPVPPGQHGLAIHVLEGGTDTVVATVPTFDVAVPMVWISWAPDAASLAIVTTEIAGPRLTLVSVADGEVRQLGRPDGLGPRAALEPIAWSPDGRRLVVRQDTGEAWVLDATQGQWQALGLTVPDALSISLPDERLQWSSDGRLAVVVGTTVTIHNFDGTPDRQVDLPGQIAAWSPDGTMIATLASSAGDPAVIWATDPWDTGESQRIASVPGTAPPDTTNPPCIQWLPEVHP